MQCKTDRVSQDYPHLPARDRLTGSISVATMFIPYITNTRDKFLIPLHWLYIYGYIVTYCVQIQFHFFFPITNCIEEVNNRHRNKIDYCCTPYKHCIPYCPFCTSQPFRFYVMFLAITFSLINV